MRRPTDSTAGSASRARSAMVASALLSDSDVDLGALAGIAIYGLIVAILILNRLG